MIPCTLASWSLLSLSAFHPAGSEGVFSLGSFLSPETPAPTTRVSPRMPRPINRVNRCIVHLFDRESRLEQPCRNAPPLLPHRLSEGATRFATGKAALT